VGSDLNLEMQENFIAGREVVGKNLQNFIINFACGALPAISWQLVV